MKISESSVKDIVVGCFGLGLACIAAYLKSSVPESNHDGLWLGSFICFVYILFNVGGDTKDSQNKKP